MIGLVAGTVLLERQALTAVDARRIDTPFGPAEVDVGQMDGVEVALVQRHGRRRDRPPHTDQPPRQPGGAGLSWACRRCWRWARPGACAPTSICRRLLVPDDYINFFDVTIFDDRLVHVTPGFDAGLRARRSTRRAARAHGAPAGDRRRGLFPAARAAPRHPGRGRVFAHLRRLRRHDHRQRGDHRQGAGPRLRRACAPSTTTPTACATAASPRARSRPAPAATPTPASRSWRAVVRKLQRESAWSSRRRGSAGSRAAAI